MAHDSKPQITFRWTVWGQEASSSELLLHSVGTFRRYFGSAARYLVCTDEVATVNALFSGAVEVLDTTGSPLNIVDTRWRKWCPRVRLSPERVEFYVDADVFIVGEPAEVRRFAETEGSRFLVWPEANPEPMYGLFQPKVNGTLPPINAGFLGQQAHADLTAPLADEVMWWQDQVDNHGASPTRKDEQGAVAAVMARQYAAGSVEILPTDRYRVVSPRSNFHLIDLDGIAMIHATWNSHPAFYMFRNIIRGHSDFG